MATVNEKMTALADEIRELSGTTTTKSIDAMTSNIDAANTEIAEQSDLISQIVTALEGKASGGGGDSGNDDYLSEEVFGYMDHLDSIFTVGFVMAMPDGRMYTVFDNNLMSLQGFINSHIVIFVLAHSIDSVTINSANGVQVLAIKEGPYIDGRNYLFAIHIKILSDEFYLSIGG